MPVWSCALPSPALPTERVRRVIDGIWATMLANPRHAGPRMAEGLRAARTLGSKERPVAGDVLSGLMRHHRALLRIAEAPELADARARLDWCADPVLRAWYLLCEVGVPGLPDPADPVDAYAIAVSMPVDIAREWWERLGPERAVAHARTIAGRAPMTLRVLREGFTLSVPFRRVGERALVLEGRLNLDIEPAFVEGHVEVQDLGSQGIVDAAWAGLGPGARVLDMCAGAGGKSLSLAALGATVQAWDVRQDALRALAERARRAGLPIRIAPPEGSYDLVLVDAPCSGTGVLRRHPENRWRMEFPMEIQRDLLGRAARMAPAVVYATCSLLQRENDALVRSVAEPVAERTIWPEDGGAEGFYWARVGSGVAGRGTVRG